MIAWSCFLSDPKNRKLNLHDYFKTREKVRSAKDSLD